MNADEMTVERFDELLPTLEFKLLTYPDRHAYEGAGPRCLYASADGIDVLYEGGEYSVFGVDGDGAEGECWCVQFTDDGERIQIM